jgi:heme-degrading monooxygenase HmoA
MSRTPVVEVVLSRVKPGVEPSEVIEAADAIMPDVRAAGGFIRRELLKGSDDQWIDVIYWESLEQAQHAAALVMSRPAAAKLHEIIDGPSVRMYHAERVRTYDS